jgi:hypothetical protein
MRNLFFCLLLIILSRGINSCEKKYVNEEQLKEFVLKPENGLIQVDSFDNILFRLKYQPVDLLLKNDLVACKRQGNNFDSCYETLNKSYNKYVYFILECSSGNQDILKNSSESLYDFKDKLSQLSFDLDHCISIISNRDTIPLAYSYYPRTYGMLNMTSILISFPKKEIDQLELIKINFNDKIFGTGIHQFNFHNTDIKNIPKLELRDLINKT